MIASQRGHHAKTISPIVDPDFREKFCSHVRSESCRKGTFPNVLQNVFVTTFYEDKNSVKLVLKLCLKFVMCLGQPHLTTAMLAQWVNSELELGEAENYSEECIRQWLHKCGFKVLILMM